jgi:hypothetical protein
MLNVEEKVKVISEIQMGEKGGGEADVCREFVGNLGLKIIRSKLFGETEPKLLVRLNRTDRKSSDFESLDEVMLVRCCLSGLSKREVTLYQ